MDAEPDQPDRFGRSSRGSPPIPHIQAKVVMISSRSDKQGAGERCLGDSKAEKVMVETFRFTKIGDVQMDVSDAWRSGAQRSFLLRADLGKEGVEVERRRNHPFRYGH